MEKLEHIGIAVKNIGQANKLFSRLLGRDHYKNIGQANKLFSRLLGSDHYKIEDVVSEKVRTSFFRIGDVKIELLEATDETSPIARFINKKGEGIHHLAFEVSNIHESLRHYQDLGFELINNEPKAGADNKLVVFLHPKSTGGVLIELCQEIS
jgi:methylmalonyl-CoA/ethylmalonyl-CoA epimerase